MTGPAALIPTPVDVLVAIPAHNEAERIGACLRSVSASLTAAVRAGWVGRSRIAVALHRCTDDTADRVAASGVEAFVVTEHDPLPVGTVRTRLVRAALAGDPVKTDGWLFSTDADTVVPPDWVTATLAVARREDARLVLGLADLSAWDADEPAHRRYRDLVEAGMTDDGHRHAYAANLAIDLTTFTAVGGFPALEHGEEHGLARAVRAAGLRVATPLSPRVQTSARMPGRAAAGLGALLQDLADPSRREELR